MHFISFSCLIAVVTTSSTLLSRNGESRHPYLDLSQSFTIKCDVGCSFVLFCFASFCRGLLSGLGSSLLYPVCCEIFIING